MGIVIGVIGSRKFSKEEEELNTDICMEYLQSKGYYVNLNLVQKKER